MELTISITIFLFGILTWIPFLNNVYGQDMASAMWCVDQMKKGNNIFYRDSLRSSPGHYLHIWLFQLFFKKENSVAFYSIMALYNALSSTILFWVVLGLFKETLPAIFSSIIFSLYIVSPRLDGNWAPFEQLIALPILGSILLLLKHVTPDQYLIPCLAGLLFGYAILIKQVAAAYTPGFIFMCFGAGYTWSQFFSFILGVFVINATPAIFFWLRYNALYDYLVGVWLYLFPQSINPDKSKYYPKFLARGNVPKESRWTVILDKSKSLLPALYLGVVGIVILIFRELSFFNIGLILCLAASITMIFMKGTFFGHYWLNIIPWLSIFAGYGLFHIIDSTSFSLSIASTSIAAILAVIVLFLKAIHNDKKYYVISKDSYAFLNKVYGNSAGETYKSWYQVGEYINKITTPEQKVLISGWAPHILLMSDRQHFTKDISLQTIDYQNCFVHDDISTYYFLNDVLGFDILNKVKLHPNPFIKGAPDIIVIAEGKPDISVFEKLSGNKYSLDENLNGYPLFHINKELTELLVPYETFDTIDPIVTDVEKKIWENLDKATQNQDWQSAYYILRGIVKSDPQNINYTLGLVDCLFNLKNYRLFFEFIDRLFGINFFPASCQIKLANRKGSAMAALGNINVAKQIFEQILKVSPNDIEASQFLTEMKSKEVACGLAA
jgi:hypothetical protein